MKNRRSFINASIITAAATILATASLSDARGFESREALYHVQGGIDISSTLTYEGYEGSAKVTQERFFSPLTEFSEAFDFQHTPGSSQSRGRAAAGLIANESFGEHISAQGLGMLFYSQHMGSADGDLLVEFERRLVITEATDAHFTCEITHITEGHNNDFFTMIVASLHREISEGVEEELARAAYLPLQGLPTSDEFAGVLEPGLYIIRGTIDLTQVPQGGPEWGGTFSIDMLLGDAIGQDCPGETNGSGVVDVDDLNNILSVWNQEVGPKSPFDIAGDDGVVNVDDLNVVLANWLRVCE